MDGGVVGGGGAGGDKGHGGDGGGGDGGSASLDATHMLDWRLAPLFQVDIVVSACHLQARLLVCT